jgi:chromosome partitioning protein
MHVIAVVNLKGGCGKTTVSTHLAARFARLGHRPLLVDLDKQKSALHWVGRRAGTLPVIDALALDADELDIPRGHPFVVVDVPAGLKKRLLEDVVRAADAIIVPVLPGAFDEAVIERFLGTITAFKDVQKGRRPIAVVANRVRRDTPADRRLDLFLEALSYPAIAKLADSQFYISAAENGVTLFDQPVGRVRKALEEWKPLLAWVDQGVE